MKGDVSVISSDPPCKDGNAWFTTVLLKALSDQVWIKYQCLNFKIIFFVPLWIGQLEWMFLNCVYNPFNSKNTLFIFDN